MLTANTTTTITNRNNSIISNTGDNQSIYSLDESIISLDLLTTELIEVFIDNCKKYDLLNNEGN